MAGNVQFDISSLGYLVIASDDLSEWKRFAGPGLGMQVIDTSDSTVAFRMDDHAQRFVVTKSPRPALYTIGWQAASDEALNRLAARLEEAGVEVEQGTRSMAEERMVKELIIFQDPAGNCVEVFCGPALLRVGEEGDSSQS